MSLKVNNTVANSDGLNMALDQWRVQSEKNAIRFGFWIFFEIASNSPSLIKKLK
jgi:hypothetical protein